jgi:hypothetical protein
VSSRNWAALCCVSSWLRVSSACWVGVVVGNAVEDGSSWSMDMLGHSGRTSYGIVQFRRSSGAKCLNERGEV